MKRSQVIKRTIAVVVSILVLVGLIAALCLVNREQELEKLQNEALAELEKKKGEYDERSIVLYETSPVEARQLAEKFGATLRISIDGRFAALSLPEGTTILDIYADDANREYIEKMSADYSVRVSELTDVEGDEDGGRLPVRPNYNVSDTLYSSQGYLDYVNVGDAWSKTTGSGVTVAVIDTGIDTDHPEFAGRISEYSYNASEDKIVKDYILGNGEYDWSLIEDEQGHGTAVTGVIASQMNGSGVVGLAPNVNIIVIKAECDENGTFKRSSDLVFGLYYAIERDVSVVNMSFGGPIDIYAEAAQLAFDSDIVCVAAAGNDSTTELTYPAATENVFGVGSLAEDSWTLAEYSNYGENVDLVAPGSTYTTLMGGDYGIKEGTSLSSPIVTAAIALYMSQNRYVEVKTVEEQLYASCYDLGSLGEDWIYGYGALDVNALICEERGTVTFNMLTDELENTEQVFIRNHTLQNIPEPERLYAVFDGWYYDAQCTEEYNWYEDEFSADLTLYANWVNEDDGVPFTYVELEDGTIEIRSYTGKRRFITIPDMIDGNVVSSIGDFAFYGQSRLRQVGLPSGLRNIGISAFEGCLNLVDTVIPEGVTKIGGKAFKDNVRLYTVIFEGESRLVSIGAFAFSNCSSLERIELPASLESVNGLAFFGATALEAITVRSGNKSFKSTDGVLFDIDADILVAYPAGKYGEYTIPDSVKNIGLYAFAQSKIKQIDLNNVVNIGDSAFTYSRLESVDIPNSVIAMGGGAFAYCFNLKSATIGTGLSQISDSAFASTALTEIIIPSGITSIGRSAFFATPLRTVTFEESSQLVTIGNDAFASTSLTSVAIPRTVKYIGDGAFGGTLLSGVTFGEDSELLLIGSNAFENTLFLKNIVLPEKLQVIGEHAFMSSGLTTVTVPASVKTLGIGSFADCDSLTEIKVSEGNTVYKDIDGVVYTIDEKTLFEYPAGKILTSYDVPEGVTVIGAEAFYGSDILNYVYLPESLTNISEGAFRSCTNLLAMTIPDGVIQIGRFAFAQDWNLANVYISDNTQMARIGYQAFAYCGLTSMRVPANISTMAQRAFEGCFKLTLFTFAQNSKLESISAYMFDGCDNLQSIIFEQGSALTSVQAHGLEGMRKLTNIDFGDAKVTNIDNFAFRFCESLHTVDLPDTVVNIGRFAFYECNALSALFIPAGIEHIGRYAFWGTNDVDLYFDEETMPPYLDEYWDEGIRSYHMGVSEVIVGEEFKYALLDDGSISIVEYTGEDTAVDLTAADLGGDITAIGGSAFRFSEITSVKLPETLITIQAEAFAHSKLESVAIPASVEFIGREAFYNSNIEKLTFGTSANTRVIEHDAFAYTKKLKSVVIPKSVEMLGTAVFEESGLTSLSFEEGTALTEIPERAFAATAIASVTIPDSVTLINHNAFRDNTSLTSVSFGSGASIHIGSNVFYNTGLKSVNIPANIGYIGEYAFVGLENLTEFTVDESNPYYKAVDGVLMSKDGRKLIAFPAGRSGSYTVPVHVEIIGFGAFENSKLSSINFAPDANILTFGYRAFFGAKNIKSFTVPASVVSIDYYAFANCTALEKVTFAEGNKLKGIYEGAFYGCKNLNDITIPDSIVEISDFAFYGCIALDRIPVGESSGVLGVYDYAFAYTGIKELDLPETLIDIGNYAFMGLRVKEITVPDTNAKQLIIGLGAFADCMDLGEITLPFIGASFEDPDYTWFGYIFGAGGYEANATYVPESLKKVTITEGISTVGYGGFYNITSIEEIDVPHSVTMIEPYSFGGTTARYELTNEILTVSWYDHFGDPAYFVAYSDHFGEGLTGDLRLAEGVTSIGNSAFEGCSSLTSINIPDSVTSIGGSAFSGCSSLTSITIGDSVTEIGGGAFSGCSSLTSIEIPDSVTSIGWYAFSGCSSLTSIEIPDSVTSIGDSAFSGCSSLTSIIIPDSVTSIGRYAFNGCSSLTSIIIPDGVTSIGWNAFEGCSSLTSINIPDSVTSIGERAFDYCSSLNSVYITDIAAWCGISFGGNDANPLSYAHNLYLNGELVTDVVIPDGVTSIGRYAFYFCRSLTSITIPDSVTSIGGAAFRNCSSLTSITIGDSVTSIGDEAFSDCSSLTSINIPDSVTSIGSYAFDYCSSLNSVYITDIAAWCGISFGGNDANPLAYAHNLYLNGELVTELVIPDSVTSIGDFAFYECSSLTSINIPDGVTSIGNSAFDGCSSLTSITIPDSVTSIGDEAFRECRSLYQIYNNSGLNFNIGAEDNGYIAYHAIVIVDKYGNTTYREDGVEYIITEDDFLFTKNNDEYTLRAYLGQEETVTLPENINGNAYYISNMSGVVNVIIPDSVTSIGYEAFDGCSSLTSITIPDSVTSIGWNAFEGCSNLTSISIPDSVTSIFGGAFSGCSSLTSISIPDSVTSIFGGAFSGCSSLTSITIPDSVTSIWGRAFEGCSSLTSITIPDSVTSIGEWAFRGCSSLTSISIPDSVTSIGNSAFYNCSSLTSINIPDSVTSIGNSAFYNCSSLTSITISDGVMSIGRSAFSGCSSLTKVSIGKDVAHIGEGAFVGCVIDDFEISDENLNLIEIDGIIYDKEITSMQYVLPSIVSAIIPDSVTTIGDYAFRGCSSLTSITIPDGVTSIGNCAFSGCSSLTSIEIPNGVTAIGERAFEGCSSLTSITIPDSVTTIGRYAFSDCSSLTSISIPDSVTEIGGDAFEGCSSLTSITIPDSVTWIASGAFRGCSSLTSITIGDGVTWIGYEAFEGCSSLTSITIPDSVTSIGKYAFSGCSRLNAVHITDIAAWCGISFGGNNANPLYCAHNLYLNGELVTEIVIPNSVTSIGDEAFHGCSSLTSITIPDSVTEIGSYAFSGCSSLTSITIPDSVTSIGEWAFSSCRSLTSITIPDSITTIEGNAFSGCSSLTSITIPDGVTSIGGGAFSRCSSLTSINIPDSVTSIGGSAFSGCSSLTSITIPDGVTSIGQWTFFDCGNLNAVHITDIAAWCGISFGTNPLSYARNLYLNGELITELVIPDGVTSIGERAFSGCSSLTSITIPSSVTSIGNCAFENCSSLYQIYNNSDLSLVIGSQDNGFTAYYAEIIVDKNGKVTYRHDDVEYIITEEDFLFTKNNGVFTLIAYLGGKETVTLPENINTSSYNICEMRGVINVIIPDGVTSIGDRAFYGCSSLTSITIPDGVTSIGDDAFHACYGLTSITIPDSVTSIGEWAFSGCNLTSITIPDSVTSIGDRAFYACSSLTSIIIPDGVTEIGERAFAGCYSLTSITIPDGVTTIGEGAFSGCSSLTSITIPDSVTSIGYRAFSDCSSLTSITIPDSVTEIGGGAFYGTALYNDKSNWQDGSLIIDGCLIELNKDTVHFPNRDIRCIAYGALDECYKLKTLILSGTSERVLAELTNLETLIITDMPDRIIYYFGRYISDLPITLKNIVLANGVKVDTNDFYDEAGQPITNINIFVEASKLEAQHWNENYIGWNAGNKVIYGDDWVFANFYGSDGISINSGIFKTSQIIRVPYVRDYTDGINQYIFEGFDINGDGVVDSIPATSGVNIEAKAIFSSYCLHSSIKTVVEKAPTCTEGGAEKDICEHCGEVLATRFPSATGHDYTAVVTAPTCTEKGYTTHTCHCGDSYVDSYVDAFGHSFGEWIETKAPTCTEAGSERRDCERCDHFETREIEATGHDYKSVVTAPTCTEKGYTTHTCHCGDSYVDTYVDALGHSFGEWVETKAPTCTEAGSERRDCANCDHFETREVAATGHSHTSVVTAPTCTEQGYTTHTCHCGDSYVDNYVDALGHSFGNWIVVTEPTCTEKGSERRDCERCDHFETREVAATGHDHTSVVTDPTCTEKGYTTHTCHCGDSYVDTYVDALGHSFGEWITTKDPTEEAEGEKMRECGGCGHKEYGKIPVLDHVHKFESVVTAPTCTEKGYTTHTCHCGDSYVDNYVDALGHSFGDWVETKAPTCTAKGEERRDCERCDHFETREVAATGHDYKSVVTAPTCTEQGYTTHTCHCGDSYVDTYVDALGHSFGEWITTKDPTEEAEGEKMRECGGCGHKEYGKIPVLDHVHKFESVVTAPTCTEKGYTTHTCHCGDSYVDTYVDALGHSFGDWVETKAPTCTEAGSERRDCANCDHFETREVAAEGHSYTDVVTAPTCTEKGYTTHTCHCGDSYVDSYVDATGHEASDWIIDQPAEVGVEGKKHKECVICHELLEEATIEALPPEEKPTEKPTEQPTEQSTEQPTEEPTADANDGTEATDSTQGAASSSDKPAENEGGCGSALLPMSAVIILSMLAAAPTFLKRKREE